MTQTLLTPPASASTDFLEQKLSRHDRLEHESRLRRYLPEIDTLRAVAVLLVLLFHGYPSLVPGGFVGVDVFFVISGYVISRKYMTPLLTGQAALSNFYAARFRRLTPALFLTVAATTMASYFLLLPRDLAHFGQSLVSQPVYLQNIYYWNQGDYFVLPLAKPLLHTWSLAVEEQFYLFFGMLCLIGRNRHRVFWMLLIAFSVVSLCAYLFLQFSAVSPRTAFYLLPGRLWQLGLGILAFALARQYKRSSQAISPILSFLAVVVICAAPFAPADTPLLWQLRVIAACAATACALVLFETFANHYGILRTRALRYIGEISYPLYLWHWPLISLPAISLHRELSSSEATLAIVATFLLASMTYHFVENPIRRARVFSTGTSLAYACGIAFIVTLSAAALLIQTSGAAYRYPKDLQLLFAAEQDRPTHRCPLSSQVLHPLSALCPINFITGGASVLVLGDSHADQLLPVLAEVGQAHGIPVVFSKRASCMIGQFGPNKWCSHRQLQSILSEAKANNVTDVISISIWEPKTDDRDQFERNVEEIVTSGLRITFMERVPVDAGFDPTVRAERAVKSGRASYAGIPLTVYLEQIKALREFLRALSSRYPSFVFVLSPERALCTNAECEFHTGGRPNYFDTNHVTQTGAARIKPIFEPTFERVEAGR